ncbi:MAG: DUF2334 domain-containing protein [Chloroflexi bacterium]|nr:DUF2334 domain-containing protein [Chloroflexota bacterium]
MTEISGRVNQKISVVLLLIMIAGLLVGCAQTDIPAVNQMDISQAEDPSIDKNVVVFYDDDAGDQWNYGKLYALMVRNLLGHFRTEVTLVDVGDYQAGMLADYAAGLYIGNIYDYPLSDDFLQDVINSQNPFLWMNSNIWQLFKIEDWGAQQKLGFQFIESDIINPAINILYKGIELPRLESDVYFNLVSIEAGSQCEELATLQISGAKDQPYAIRCGDFYYITHNPMSNFYASYLVFADLLHDLLDTDVVESHRALVRFEDLTPGNVNYDVIREQVDFLYEKGIPFTFGVIPVYTDPEGVWGEPGKTVYLYEDFMLQDLIKYMIAHGGTPVLHGYTHQYDSITGVDYEFWDGEKDVPFPEDDYNWASQRIAAGIEQFRKAFEFDPVLWETPHYSASPNTYFALAQYFDVIYERVMVFNDVNIPSATNHVDYNKIAYISQTFPYQIFQSFYGLRIIPSNLGYLEEGGEDEFGVPPTSAGKVQLAKMYSVVRDGVVSFMFHHWQPSQNFYDTVNGLEEAGYTFMGVEQLLQETPPPYK